METLMRAVVVFRDARNWKQFHNPKDSAISLVLEAAEVMEHFQWKNKPEMREHVRKHKQDIADELSDVLYWVLLIAHDLAIDIPKSFKRKLKENKRKYPVAKSKGKHHKYTAYTS
ncbi:hypothetical protein A3D66_00420 [Candidatus Kaiserbacteria bacterium RIFCSPHIGHO2_02_FULL_50_9]|uniref:Nucleotide pyrophosphohydrolase n=1 Tax=Candidatus Kaiserbacteria bacterium RIFCSPLOWO2_01_FULL_51_21 TaxID=1798508 RepID=A0A1F6ED04_9BACT|nr:MAG: hypothetical protein A2761_01900 [Candidatus Kaiserbacteria bacterium RIFCSPHIGHO2_01_FULL_51_33]OGG63198.1 MAG: hypothetical protein A3D66_00420 [Candidatus Kaiserbacteria bacterium RIFCSPHIGHO2_02_FULL_50_9]OGG71564.1 MAG: hypothetical protein A3A35_00200 [Candidatus Kaiserbacteria bacterium RIFCSPLOWO2_01_FULL_51_21]